VDWNSKSAPYKSIGGVELSGPKQHMAYFHENCESLQPWRAKIF